MDAPLPSDPTLDRTRRALWLARLVLPFVLAGVGYAILVSQRWKVEHEVQLLAPTEAVAGAAIPLRAFVFADVDDEDGARLVPADVEVSLGRGNGALASATLAPSIGDSREGALVVPTSMRRGGATLRGVARIGGVVVATVERPIEVVPEVGPVPLGARISSRMGALALGPVELASPDAVLDGSLDVRVRGGACVPDAPCEVLVHAGPTLTTALEAGPSLEVQGMRRLGEVVTLRVVVHGAEASTRLVATATLDGAPVAARAVRLPVALATPWVEVSDGTPPRISVRPPPGRTALAIDDFVGGRWVASGPLAEDATEPPFPLAEGLHRLQVRADPFGGSYVASRYVRVGHIAGDDVVRALADEGFDASLDALPLAMRVAAAEEAPRELPAASSGLEADRREVSARRARVAVAGGVALAIGLVLFVALLLRRGLDAAAEARQVLVDAGVEGADEGGARRRSILGVVALALGVGLALALGAVVVLARAALGG